MEVKERDLLLLLLLAFLLSPILAVQQTSVPTVYYQSWLEVLNTPSSSPLRWRNTTEETLLTGVSNSDDLFEPLLLPFAFPYMGVDRFVAYVGANGYVQFDSTNSPPCISQISYGDSNVFVTMGRASD